MYRLLVVDDDEALLQALERKFEAYGDLEVEVARDGIEAMKLAEESIPDVMLLDLLMPEMDGYELIERVRGLPRGDEVVLIILSNVDPTDEVRSKISPYKPAAYYIKSEMALDTLVRTVAGTVGVEMSS